MNTKNQKTKITFLSRLQVFAFLCLAMVMVFGSATMSYVQADRFQDQINALSAQNDQKAGTRTQLGAQAANLSETIAKLQAEINALQAKINSNQAKVSQLRVQIKEAEEELARQRVLLGEIIKEMYLAGDITTVEMLASSKNLSDFFDKQQYRESVQSKIKTTLDKITKLKLELNSQKETVEKLIAEQKELQGSLGRQRAENNRLLSLNQAQQGELNRQIQHNSAQIAELRRQQAIENARHGSGVIAGDPSKGGYPAKWANAPQDSMIDDWGMYNRECVSYTAWKVYQSGRFMPYWGGRGNANQWPNNTANKSKTPRVGDVAIAYWGYYGHAMYVEAVRGSQVYVSQYNYGVRGEYSEMWVNISDIGWFLHF